MIKLKHLICTLNEEVNSSVLHYAKSKGYIYPTYRGDVYADKITSYSPKERREHGIFTTPIKDVAKIYARDHEPRAFILRGHKVLNLMNDTIENMKWVENGDMSHLMIGMIHKLVKK